MPKELHDKLLAEGKRKGLKGKELNRYVYGAMWNKLHPEQKKKS
jgi:hypothetical protein